MQEFVFRGKSRNLSKAVSVYLPVLTYGFFRKLLRKGEIKVNGVKVKEDVKLSDGDEVKVYFDYAVLKPVPLFINDDVAVFYKPPKIASDGENSFSELVKFFYPDFALAHRLDTNTDGLIIFAKRGEAEEALKEAFRRRYVEKHYLALCNGTGLASGTYKAYLKKIPEQSRVVVSNEKEKGSEEIATIFNVIEQKDGLSLLDVELITGKTHQIRAHLAHLGHMIIGDPKYGRESVNRLYGQKRQCLTAYKLIFRIPCGKLAYLNGTEIILPKEKLKDFFI